MEPEGKTEGQTTRKKPQGEKDLQGLHRLVQTQLVGCMTWDKFLTLPGIFLHLQNRKHPSTSFQDG